jgi:hypothetical protein
MAAIQINLAGWQDYRGNHTGVLMFTETSKHAMLPVRDQLNDNGKGNIYEPNYETNTFGLKSSYRTKEVNGILKAKHRYLLFANKYEGINPEFKNKYIVYGYMKIEKIRDVKSMHLHRHMNDPSLPEPECMTMSKAQAIYSADANFYNLEDCFELSKEKLIELGFTGRISKQMRLVFENDVLDQVISHFQSKTPANDEYIATVSEFIEFLEEDEDED